MRLPGIASALVVLALALSCVAGCASSEPVVIVDPPRGSSEPTRVAAMLADIEISLDPAIDGFEQPVYVTGAGDDSGRLFVVEKTGRVWVVRDGERVSGPWLDLSALVSTQSERGLLGIAFAPDFSRSGSVYLHYSDTDGNTRLDRLVVDARSDLPVSEPELQELLSAVQPFSNHNGGMIEFGPDGYLYVALGDGGSGGDPQGNGQNAGTLLGSMLRVDVRAPDGDYVAQEYSIPADNPFADGNGGLPEIWAIGLRNPWRFSFDRLTGDMWIGDVGQNAWEEIDLVRADEDGLPAGLNFGWSAYEGTHPYPSGSTPSAGDFTQPVIEYDHSAGNSVTGGYVYRGDDHPDLQGIYFYGDFGSGRIWGARFEDGSLVNRELLESDLQVVSFGQDDRGELYVVDFSGTIYAISQK